MKALATLLILTLALTCYAQPAGDQPTNPEKIKEVPAADHSKTVSELAKATPGGHEKGGIISSAARQHGLHKSAGAARSENKPESQNTHRPESAGKPEMAGKPASINPMGDPRAVPTSKPRPAGIYGRN
jgi:hypothetical protein